MGPARTVLIADDHEDIRALLGMRLRLDPQLVVIGEATNGAEAIIKALELNPSALILDLQMPVMSGEEAIPILRSLAPELRILLFSARAGVGGPLSDSGLPDAEIAKGGDLRLLVREVHRLLDRGPCDLVDLELGIVEVAPIASAVSTWIADVEEVRARAGAGRCLGDLLALTGILLSVDRQLRRATALGLRTCELRVSTRTGAARGARRALGARRREADRMLEPLHSRLRDALLVGDP